MPLQNSEADSRLIPPGKLPGDVLHALLSTYAKTSDPSVIVPATYGFDAAAISVGEETLVIKSDPITFATTDAARYLVAVNANDLSCLGGIPRWMTVVSLLPEKQTTRELVESLFADLAQACEAEGISLIGGHTEITLGIDRPILIGTLIGVTGEHGLLHPGQAQPGDGLYVTRPVGIEGTAILASELGDQLTDALGAEVVESARKLLDDPGISISAQARAALSSGAIHAMHDPTEGGIATAVHEIAEASGLGATVDRDAIPLLHETRAICDYLGLDPLGLLSSGTLLFAANPEDEPQLAAALREHGGAVRIGTLTEPGEGFVLQSDDESQPLPRFDSDELTRVL